jgi:hypothetical protein
MKIEKICPDYRINPWKPARHLIPHLTIETNMTCNFRCRICYNLNTSHVKSLETILHEIDIGLQKRKVDTITIMGGEPTLHPDLCQIISYIKSKKLMCQLLTNGFLLYNDPLDTLLKSMVSSGLDRIILHVDKGQENYPEPVPVLHTLFAKTGKLKLLTTVSWTIYTHGQGYLPELIREFSRYQNFDGILALLEKPIDRSISPDFERENYPSLLAEHQILKNKLDLQPSVYLPSSLDDHEVSWLVYLYFIHTGSFQTFYLSPKITGAFQKIYLKIFRRELFGKPPMRVAFGLSLVLTAFVELLFKPSRLRSLMNLLKNSNRFDCFRFHYLAIQDGPSYNHEFQNVSICYGCPDATIRNEKLTPVCLADRINPYPESYAVNADHKQLASLVFNHLGEN